LILWRINSSKTRNTKISTELEMHAETNLNMIEDTSIASNNLNMSIIQANDSDKDTRIVLWISFMYAIFNLPHLIAWLVLYSETVFDNGKLALKSDSYYLALQITEVFYMLNYGIRSLLNLKLFKYSKISNQIQIV